MHRTWHVHVEWADGQPTLPTVRAFSWRQAIAIARKKYSLRRNDVITKVEAENEIVWLDPPVHGLAN